MRNQNIDRLFLILIEALADDNSLIFTEYEKTASLVIEAQREFNLSVIKAMPSLSGEEVEAAITNFADAIAAYRARTGCTSSEARGKVNEYRRTHRELWLATNNP